MGYNILSLNDLDLTIPETLQVPRRLKSKIRNMFDSSNSYFRIVAHSTNTMKVRIVTDTYNLQDEALSFLDVDNQPMEVVQPDVQTPQLEVIVTEV